MYHHRCGSLIVRPPTHFLKVRVMPEDDGYLISEADLRRISKVVRKEERSNKATPVKRRKTILPYRFDHTVVMVKNASGSSVRRREWISLSDLDSEMDGRHFQFEGQRHNLTALTQTEYGYRYGIALERLPTNGYGRVQVAGVCIAKVNISDTGHRYALLPYTGSNLTSGIIGQIEILSPVTATGEQECVVRLGPAPAPIVVAVIIDSTTATAYAYAGSYGSTTRVVPYVNCGFTGISVGQRVILSWDGTAQSYTVIGKVS